MSENNPYSAPSSDLEEGMGRGPGTLRSTPRAVAAGRGWGWITEGFNYFKRSPLNWILGMIVGFVIVLVLMFIPIIGQIAYFLVIYILVGGVMLGCHAQSQGESFQVGHVFAGFKKPVNLLLLSVIVGLLSLVVTVLVMGPSYLTLMSSNDPEQTLEAMGNINSFLLKSLFMMLLFIPISMAVWFAPALIAINDVPVIQALKMSFTGCLKNVIPFLLFGLIGIVLYVLAVIPVGLGLLIFMPTFTAASYVAYREIFTE